MAAAEVSYTLSDERADRMKHRMRTELQRPKARREAATYPSAGALARLIRLGLAAALLFAFNGGGDAAKAQDQAPTVTLGSQVGNGTAVTDPDGWTLYAWDGDEPGVSRCEAECLVAWPPYLIENPLIAPDDLPGILGLIERGDGEWQVTLDDWPLYYYSGDRQPGEISGEGLEGFGSRWHVTVAGALAASDPPPVAVLPSAQPTATVAPPTAAPTSTRRPVDQSTPLPAPTATRAATATPASNSTPVTPPGGPDSSGSLGPQFGNWGPGMAAPEPEGFGQSGSSATDGAPGAPSSAAAPYAAPPPGGVAPVPYYSGCQYDLRGSWSNHGQQITGGYRPYSSSVYVRQYRIWVQALQDDGTSYYGQCIGTRLQFDVYRGYQFVGRQTGGVSGGYWGGPVPLAGESGLPSAAPAPICGPPLCDPVPPPYGGMNIQASFTWTTWYGSGTEIWVKR